MIISCIFIIVIPILIAYLGAFVDYLIDVNMFPEDWYRTPTKMISMFLTIILIIGSMSVGLYYLGKVLGVK